MPGPEGLKFGILCDAMVFHRWQAEIIRMLVENHHQPALIILNASESQKKSSGKKLRNYPWRHLFYRLYQRYIFRTGTKQEVDLSDDLKNVPVITCKIHKIDFSEFFHDEDIDFIKDQQLDFILRFGFNIIRGKILHAATFGIWSFHHGDELKYRGGPPCFWEIYHNDPITGALLQRLNEKLDAGIILRKGWFGTIKHSYRENLDRVYSGSIPWVLQVCNDIQAGNTDYLDTPGSITKARLYKVPNNLQMLWFLLRLLKNRIKFHLNDLLFAEKWNIGIIEARQSKVAFEWGKYSKRISFIPEPAANLYNADPFIYDIAGEKRIVFEKYDYRKMQGTIDQLPVSEIVSIHPGKEVLNNGSHLSFPFVFEYDPDIYCIPENIASGKTVIYRLECNERKFEPVAELLPTPLVDPVLFRWEDKWWIFGTLTGYPSESLYIYHSDKLLGPYLAHRNNPVKVDVCSTRSAGNPFIVDGVLYRLAQNCSKTYGGSVIINQVLTLTTEQFFEQAVKEIFPPEDWKYNKGLHTLSGNSDITVIDAKRMQFIPVATLKKLKRKLGLKPN